MNKYAYSLGQDYFNQPSMTDRAMSAGMAAALAKGMSIGGSELNSYLAFNSIPELKNMLPIKGMDEKFNNSRFRSQHFNKYDQDLVESFRRLNNVTSIPITIKGSDRSADAFFARPRIPGMGDKRIQSSFKEVPALLHELGHAKNHANPFISLLLGLRKTQSLGNLGAALSIASGDEDMAKYAPLMSLSGYAPQLADEGLASYHAVKHMYDVGKKSGSGGLKELARGIKQLGPAYRSYLFPAIAPAIGFYGYNKAQEYFK